MLEASTVWNTEGSKVTVRTRTLSFKLATKLATVSLLVAASACGKPFNIKPRGEVKTAEYAAAAEPATILIEGIALTDEDFLYDTFNANLLLAGVLPVRVRMTNNSDAEVRLRRERFELRAGRRTLKSIEADRAFKRLLSFYGVSIYNRVGYKQSREALRSYELDFGKTVRPGSTCDGVIFFESRPQVETNSALVLVAKGLGGSDSKSLLELKLK